MHAGLVVHMLRHADPVQPKPPVKGELAS